jgi:hypothetical protein
MMDGHCSRDGKEDDADQDQSDCVECELAPRCLRKNAQRRHLFVTEGRLDNYAQRMREKIDVPDARRSGYSTHLRSVRACLSVFCNSLVASFGTEVDRSEISVRLHNSNPGRAKWRRDLHRLSAQRSSWLAQPPCECLGSASLAQDHGADTGS